MSLLTPPTLPAQSGRFGTVLVNTTDSGGDPTVYRTAEVDTLLAAKGSQAEIDAAEAAAASAEAKASQSISASFAAQSDANAALAQANAAVAAAASFPVASFLGTIVALDTDPGLASGNSGKWWQIGIAGALSHVNASSLTVAIGDRILSDGAVWLKYITPPTYIPEGSLTGDKLAETTIPQRAVGQRAISKAKLDGDVSGVIRTRQDGSGIEWGVVDEAGQVLIGVKADGSLINPAFTAAETAALAALPADTARGNDEDIIWAITDSAGKVLLGFRDDGSAVSAYDRRFAALEAKTPSRLRAHIIPWCGQSNATGSIDYSQTWRTPMFWGTYPPGFAGTVDGAANVTAAAVGSTQTLNSGLTALVALNANGYGFTSSDGATALCDAIVASYPSSRLITFSHGLGSATIAVLDKPTSAEITAGSASGVTIGALSAEKLMQTAGQTMASISGYAYSACATQYFKGMWLIAKAAALSAEQGYPAIVPALIWSQGEADSATATYRDDLIAFYDDYNADVQLVTGQSEPVVLVLEAMQYSSQNELTTGPGSPYQAWVDSGYLDAYGIDGSSGLYTPEASRTNGRAYINSLQWAAGKDAPELDPMRRIVYACPRYPISSRIHMHPEGHIALGEMMGKVVRKVCWEGKAWQPLQPVSWWIDGASIYVRFAAPKPPIQWSLTENVTTHTLLTGKPYGFEHGSGAIQPSNVVICGPDLVRITPDVAPALGQSLRYVYTSRYGSLCDSDQTTPINTGRGGGAIPLRNYCVPFYITL